MQVDATSSLLIFNKN